MLDGSLHVARATPEEYDEVCALKIFDELVWSLPSFSDGSFFVRSLGELARVDVVSDRGVADLLGILKGRH